METAPPVEMNDAALAEAWAAGEERAFEQIVARHTPRIFNRCRFALGAADADDATQAVFLVLARKGAQAAASPVLAAWLMQVAGNVVRNAVRDRGRRRNAERQAPPPPPPAGEPTMSDIAVHLDACLADLPDAERQAVTLHHLAGCTLAEVGAQTGAGTSTVHARVQRGLERLRALLARRGVALSSLALVAALASEAQAAVPADVMIHLRDLTTAGGGTGSTAIPSDRARRWSRKKLSTMTRIAIAAAGFLLVGGAVAHILVSAEPPIPSASVPAPIPASVPGPARPVAAGAVAAAPHVFKDPGWLVVRVGDLGPVIEALRGQPEMAVLDDLDIFHELGAVRHAGFALPLKSGPRDFRGDIRFAFATAPLLTRIRAGADGPEAFLGLHPEGAGWSFNAEAGQGSMSIVGETLRFTSPTVEGLSPAHLAELAKDPPAGVILGARFVQSEDVLEADLRLAEDGLRVHLTVAPSASSRWTTASLDARQLDAIPAWAVLAAAVQLQPNSVANGALVARLAEWRVQKAFPEFHGERFTVMQAAQPVLDRIGSSTLLAWIEPGAPMPTATLVLPASEADARALIEACTLTIDADGVAREMQGPVTLSLGWRAGRLIATTHPGGIDAISAPGGFTAHPEVVRALATLPKQVTACTLVRPAALIDLAMPYLPLLSAEMPMPALRQYRDRLATAQAYGLLSAGGVDGRMVVDMHGSLALAGCVLLANNAGTIARMLHLSN